ncbi:hypothetical protein DFP72DRAFT_844348 [Ephemerocybe angulata]|uniref:Uncharacterized protein n=1 Tax=Ephemerocybe angulata TaxID=980116 RepID=A0A8H6M8E5_9AGAR|nr:hypothetical protein DFP72DRAFT_844348 [Tulosesus angulatus]
MGKGLKRAPEIVKWEPGFHGLTNWIGVPHLHNARPRYRMEERPRGTVAKSLAGCIHAYIHAPTRTETWRRGGRQARARGSVRQLNFLLRQSFGPSSCRTTILRKWLKRVENAQVLRYFVPSRRYEHRRLIKPSQPASSISDVQACDHMAIARLLVILPEEFGRRRSTRCLSLGEAWLRVCGEMRTSVFYVYGLYGILALYGVGSLRGYASPWDLCAVERMEVQKNFQIYTNTSEGDKNSDMIKVMDIGHFLEGIYANQLKGLKEAHRDFQTPTSSLPVGYSPQRSSDHPLTLEAFPDKIKRKTSLEDQTLFQSLDPGCWCLTSALPFDLLSRSLFTSSLLDAALVESWSVVHRSPTGNLI